MSESVKHFTEHEVAKVLAKKFGSPHYAFLTQVRNGTGFQRKTRTADALAMSLWPSRGLHLHGFEIKVSYSDFKREVANPEKAEDFAQHCHFWWIAAPTSKVAPIEEVPPNWGLVLIDDQDNPVIVRQAMLKQETKAPDFLMLASILRNVSESNIPLDSLTEWKREVERLAHANTQSTTELAVKRIADSLLEEKAKVRALEEIIGCHINDWNPVETFKKQFALARAIEGQQAPVVSAIRRFLEIADQFRGPLNEVMLAIEGEKKK